MDTWRRWAIAGLGLLAMACGGGAGGQASQDAGIDANDFVAPAPVIDVRGAVLVHPAADPAAAPSLDGVVARVEEPFRAALEDPAATLAEAPLAADGSFAFTAVDMGKVSLGLAISVGGEAGSAFVPTSTWIFDARLQPVPSVDMLDARAHAIPRPLHAKLTEAVTTTRIQTLTGGAAASLIEAGFILGRVVDAQGAPVEGARIEPDPDALAGRIVYPTGDLSAVGDTATLSSGLFVFVHTGGDVEPFAFRVKDRPEYGARNGVASPGRATVVTVFPGTTPSP